MDTANEGDRVFAGDEVRCPSCGEILTGKDLKSLACPGCGAGLPPRLGI